MVHKLGGHGILAAFEHPFRCARFLAGCGSDFPIRSIPRILPLLIVKLGGC